MSPVLVALVAIGGLSLAIFFFFWSGEDPALGTRASVSSAVATVFALIAAIVAVTSVVWISTSDYKAEQAVKQDTARIRATLQAIIYKAALVGPEAQGEEFDRFEAERQAVDQFVLSTTAFGYRIWIDRRLKPAGTGPPDAWRAFFEDVASLSGACQPPGDRARMRKLAGTLDKLLESLNRSDLDRISHLVGDLAGALGTPFKVRLADLAGAGKSTAVTGDVRILEGPLDAADGSVAPANPSAPPAERLKDSDPENRRGRRPGDARVRIDRPAEALVRPRPIEMDGDDTPRMFRYLKKNGVNDPDVDMFAAIFDDDLAALEKALADGADTSLTDRQVLAAHQSRLENFYRAPTEQELRDLVTRADAEIGGKAGETFVHFGRAAIDGSHDDRRMFHRLVGQLLHTDLDDVTPAP